MPHFTHSYAAQLVCLGAPRKDQSYMHKRAGQRPQQPPDMRPNFTLYQPLPSETSFRVLELHPGLEDADIACSLHVHSWIQPPPFEALSYAWGDPSIRMPLLCDDTQLYTTLNLWDALVRLRQSQKSRMLWIDAVWSCCHSDVPSDIC